MTLVINLQTVCYWGCVFTLWLSLAVILYYGALYLIGKIEAYRSPKDKRIEKLGHRINFLESVNRTLQEDNVSLKLLVESGKQRELTLLNEHNTVAKRNRILAGLLKEDFDCRKTQQLKDTAFGRQTTELDFEDLITE